MSILSNILKKVGFGGEDTPPQPKLTTPAPSLQANADAQKLASVGYQRVGDVAMTPPAPVTKKPSILSRLSGEPQNGATTEIVAAPKLGFVGGVEQKLFSLADTLFGTEGAKKVDAVFQYHPINLIKGTKVDSFMGKLSDSFQEGTGALLTALSAPTSAAGRQGEALRKENQDVNTDVILEEKFQKQGIFENIKDPSWYGDRIPKVIGNMIPNLGLTIANPAAGFAGNFATQKQSLEESGVSSGRAALFSIPIAALDTLSGGVMGAPLKKLFTTAGADILKTTLEKGLAKRVTDFAFDRAKSSVLEGTTESSQNYMEQKARGTEDINWREIFENGWLGLITAGLIEGTLSTPEFVNTMKTQGVPEATIKEVQEKGAEVVKNLKNATQTNLPLADVTAPIIAQPTKDGLTVLEGNTRANSATDTVRAFIPTDTPLPVGAKVIEENVSREEVMAANKPSANGKSESDSRLLKITESFVKGEEGKPVESFQLIEAPKDIFDIKSTPKNSIPLASLKRTPIVEAQTDILEPGAKIVIGDTNTPYTILDVWETDQGQSITYKNDKTGRKFSGPVADLKYEVLSSLPPTQEEVVTQSVQEGPKSIQQIAEETNIKEPNIRRILGVGTKDGKFERVDKGVYKLSINGKDLAYVEVGSSIDVLPRLAKEGFKADMIFLDIPYDTPAVKGGGKNAGKDGQVGGGVGYVLISVDEFSTVLDAAKTIARNDNSPIIHMYSNAASGMKKMQKYNDLFIAKGFKPVGKGSLAKMNANGTPVGRPTGAGYKIAEPEGIIVFTKSGQLDKDLQDLNFKLVRPKGYQTEKPAEMIRKMIEMTTEEGDVILDPFAGSGVVGAEATRAGRQSYSVERNPDVARGITMPRIESAVPDVTMATPSPTSTIPNLPTEGAPETLPDSFSSPQIEAASEIETAYQAGDIDQLTALVGEGGMFVVSTDTTSDLAYEGTVIPVEPDVYKARSGLSLEDGQKALMLKTPFTDAVDASAMIVLPGVGLSFSNAITSIAQAFIGSFRGNILAPIMTLNRQATVSFLKLQGVKNILSLVIDPATGNTGLQFVGIEQNRYTTNRIYAKNKYGISEKNKEVFAMKEAVEDGFNAVVKNITKIADLNPTKNSLTGEDMSLVDRSRFASIIKAIVLDNNVLMKHSELSANEKNILKQFAAVSHAYAYYPNQVADLIGPNLSKMIKAQFDYDAYGQRDFYQFGGNILVQKDALLADELDSQDVYSKGFNLDRTAEYIPPEERAYEHFVTLGGLVRNFVKTEVAIPEGFETLESYFDYLKILQNKKVAQTDFGANINQEIARIKDIITKEKGQDNLDIYRIKSPLFQMNSYADHVANVVFQDNVLGIYGTFEKLIPGNLKTNTKGLSVGLIQDTFLSDPRVNELGDHMKNKEIYGKTNVSNAKLVGASANSAFQSFAVAAAFGYAGVNNFLQSLVTLGMVYSNPRTYLLKFKGRSQIEQFFIENAIVEYEKDGNSFYARTRDQVELNKLWQRVVLDKDQKTNKFTAHIAAAPEYSSIVSGFFFGNLVESWAAQRSAMLFIADEVKKVTGKDYVSEAALDAPSVIADFNGLDAVKKTEILTGARQNISRNYNPNRTKSNILIFRNKATNLLRGWVSKFVATNVVRAVNVNSLGNSVVKNLISNPEFKALNKQYAYESKIVLRQTVGLLSLIGLAATAFQKSGDEEDKEEKPDLATSINLAYNYVISGFLDADGMNIRAVLNPISTGLGYASQFSQIVYDMYLGKATNNDLLLEDATRRWLNLLGAIGSLSKTIDIGDKVPVMTSTGRVAIIKEYDASDWAIDESIPGNLDYQSRQTLSAVLKHAKDTGNQWYTRLLQNIFANRMYQAESALVNNFGALTSFYKDTTTKKEVYKKAHVFDVYNAVVRENPDKNLDQVVNIFLTKMAVSYNDKPESFTNLQKWVTTNSKLSVKMMDMFNNVDFLKKQGFSYSLDEKAMTTMNKVRNNTEIAAAFYDYIYRLTTFTEDDLKLKENLAASLKTPNEKSTTWDALARVELNNRYSNGIKRDMAYFIDLPDAIVDGKVEVEAGERGQAKTSKSIELMDYLESVLAFSSSNNLVENDIYQSLQELSAKSGFERLETLFKKGLINPQKYPYMMNAYLYLQDQRTAPYGEDQKDVEVDYSVLGKVSGYNGKKAAEIVAEPTQEYPSEYPANSKIDSPYYGIAQVVNGNIVIQDVFGRYYAFSNVTPSVKNGEVVKPGKSIGTAGKDGAMTNAFDRDKVPATPLPEPITEIDRELNYFPTYLARTGNTATIAATPAKKGKKDEGQKAVFSIPKETKGAKKKLSVLERVLSKQQPK